MPTERFHDFHDLLLVQVTTFLLVSNQELRKYLWWHIDMSIAYSYNVVRPYGGYGYNQAIIIRRIYASIVLGGGIIYIFISRLMRTVFSQIPQTYSYEQI